MEEQEHEYVPLFDVSSRKLMEKIKGVEFVHDDKLRERVLRVVKELCGASPFLPDFPGKQLDQLTARKIPNFKEATHQVSFKSHSKRFLMFINKPEQTFFVDEENNVFRTEHLSFPCRADPKKRITGMVLDGDIVIDQEKAKRIPRFLARDVANLKMQQSKNFLGRRRWITEELIKARAGAAQRGLLKLSKEALEIKYKDFFELDCAEKILAEKFRKKVPHRIDGLQFHTIRFSPKVREQFSEWDQTTSRIPGSLSSETLFSTIRGRFGARPPPATEGTKPIVPVAKPEYSGRSIGSKAPREDEDSKLMPPPKSFKVEVKKP